MELTDKQRKVLDRVEKLFRLAENNPSEEEAKAATAKAQEILASHNLRMEDLKLVEETEVVTVVIKKTQTRTPKWKVPLRNIVARHFQVQLLWNPYSYIYIGRKADCIVSQFTYDYLKRVIPQCFVDNYPARFEEKYNFSYNTLDAGMKRRERNSYYMGFCIGLEMKLKENADRMRSDGVEGEDGEEGATGQEMSLVLCRPPEIDEIMESMDIKQEKAKVKITGSSCAFHGGREDGENCEIGVGLNGGNGDAKGLSGCKPAECSHRGDGHDCADENNVDGYCEKRCCKRQGIDWSGVDGQREVHTT